MRSSDPDPSILGTSSRSRRDESTDWFADLFGRLQGNVERVLLGKPDVVRMALVCLIAEGHLLIDDVPGVGKTSLAKAIAQSVSATCTRIQFTPDLLPSDVTGSQVWDPGSRLFVFHPGPVFANLVVADEINRASPRTQSALLEVMEEGQVSVDGVAHRVPHPFLVVATQNPVEFDGTYRLPEAQIDRFMMRLTIGYPGTDDEVEVVLRRTETRGADGGIDEPKAVMDIATVESMMEFARDVYLAEPLARYCVQVCAATRHSAELRLGVSPRGGRALAAAGRVLAAVNGRDFVTVDDIKAVAPAVLVHRMLLTGDAELDGHHPEELLASIVSRLSLPTDRAGR